MKKLSIFSIVLAIVTLFAGCTKEAPVKALSELEVSKTYVAIAPAGGSVDVTFVASEAWSFKSEIPDWITVSAKSAAAGTTTKVTFSAPACEYGREAVLQVAAGVHTQFITVRQGNMVAEAVSCKVAMTGTAGKTYKVTGAVTKIVNTTYGNLYISDGSIKPEDKIAENACYIYGTLDEKGAEKNFSSLGIEVGDVITVEGPLAYHGTTPELVNVTVSKIEKSLLKLVGETATAVKEGGVVSAKVAYKGKGAYASILDGAESWITLKNTEFIAGVPSKLIKEPADTLLFHFAIAANEAGAREGKIQFSSSNSTSTSNGTFTVKQEGAIREVSVKEFIDAPVGEALYKVSGVITKVDREDYGNVNIKDYSGEVYVYGIGNKGDFTTLGLKEGDIVTLIGPRADHNGPQMKNSQYVSHKSVTTMTCAQAIALSDDNGNDPQNYVRVTGTVTDGSADGHKFDLETYGNFDLVDESGSAYVYGVSTGWNGEAEKFGTLGVKKGDKLTIVAYKTSYTDSKTGVVTHELKGMYLSHESGETPEPPTPTTSEYSIDLAYEKGTNSYEDKATINGVADQKVLKIGTGKAAGSMTVTVPAGAYGVTFYAVAWKSNATTIVFKSGDQVVKTQDIAANDGATSNSPYTITVSDTDKYTVNFGGTLSTDTKFTVTTPDDIASSKYRAIFFGIKALKEK